MKLDTDRKQMHYTRNGVTEGSTERGAGGEGLES